VKWIVLPVGAWLVLAQATSPLPEAEQVAVLEVLIRSVASEHCARSSCYVSVNGKAPSEAFAQRLADVPHVRPIPENGVPPNQRAGANFIDLFAARSSSHGHAEVSAAVSADIAGTLIAFESCTYHFAHGASGWKLKSQETMCLVL